MKVLEKRLEECMNIRIQIKNLGIEAHHSEELQPLFHIMNLFVREGTPASGKIHIHANNFSSIEYRFASNESHESYCHIIR